MKFITFYRDSEARLGVLHDGLVVDVAAAVPGAPSDLKSALEQQVDMGALGQLAMDRADMRMPVRELRMAPAVHNPGKVICLGLNYFAHAAEGGRARPDYPWFFLRGATSLIGHHQAAWKPLVSDQLDYEAELAVVIGKRARHKDVHDALDCVFGYTCFNDISVRDYQKKTPQLTIGKNFDRTGCLGPAVTMAGNLPDGAKGLRIRSRLNGHVMQDADTSEMIWPVAETIALLTECMTLEPGDIIAMGTPSGVGQSRQPPVWLRPGDIVEVEIDALGTLSNTIVCEPKP